MQRRAKEIPSMWEQQLQARLEEFSWRHEGKGRHSQSKSEQIVMTAVVAQ